MRERERVEQASLRWYGHVIRMDRSRYPRKVMESMVPGVRARGRPRKGWEEDVYDAIRAHSQDVEETNEFMNDRVNWRRLCRIRR